MQPYNGFWGPAVSYSPDGKRLAEGSEGGFVTLFNTATGAVIKRIQIGAQAPVVTFDPTGTLLAVGTDHDVRIVNAHTGAIQQKARTNNLTWGPFTSSADGKTVFFADLQSIVRWDIASNTLTTLASGGVNGVGKVPYSWAQSVLSSDESACTSPEIRESRASTRPPARRSPRTPSAVPTPGGSRSALTAVRSRPRSVPRGRRSA